MSDTQSVQTKRFRMHLDDGPDTPQQEFVGQRMVELDAVFEAMAQSFQVPMLDVTVQLTPDFQAAVEQAWRDSAKSWLTTTGSYNPERLGGQAVAKTLDLTEDGFRQRVVINSSALGQLDTPAGQMWALHVLSHELAHTLLERLRHSSGALEGVVFPSVTPTECARSMVRVAVDEIRADRVADLVVGTFAKVTMPDGQTKPAQITDAFGAGYRGQIADVLDTVIHPGWPNTVHAYQLGQLSLQEMFSQIGTQTDQVITLLARAHAEALRLERPGALEDECRDHPGATLYLAPAWSRIVHAMGEDLIPDGPEPFLARERHLLDEAEVAVLSMWERLGLTFDIHPNRSFYIHVAAPQR